MTNSPFLVSATTDNGSDTQQYEGPVERVKNAARDWSMSGGINSVVVLSNDEQRDELARFVKGVEQAPIQ